jgi:glycosyltransferase involved in cell wall biosynthesis
MKNVLIIDNSRYITGASKSIALFANELSPKYNFFWAVTAAISDEELKHLIQDQPFQRFEFLEISKRFYSVAGYFPHLLKNTLELRKLVKENNISIVHSNDCYNMCGVLLKILDSDIKVIYHIRLLPNSYIGRIYGTLMRFIKRYADAVVCCSHTVSESVGEMPLKKVIYDSDVFADNDNKETIINTEVKNIIYVGNILPGKGQALAIKAFALTRQEYPNLRLRFIGKFDHNKASINFKKYLDSIIKENSLENNVVFEGFKYDIEKEIEKADILLNLSESESFSMVCLEALKTGIPLITANSGGPAELFEHMKSGWLVPNRDIEAASEAIKELVRNRSLREQFSFEGKKYVCRKFNIIENARELDNLYAYLLNQTEKSIDQNRRNDFAS